MIETAAIVAANGIIRLAQDAYGAPSQQRAALGLETGVFTDEIEPITVDKTLFDVCIAATIWESIPIFTTSTAARSRSVT